MPVPLIRVPTICLWGDHHMNAMNRFTIMFLLILMGAYGLSGQTAKEDEKQFLAVLKEGQPVSLKEVTGRYQISTFDGFPGAQSHKVLEVASDHIVVQDISGVAETHIPVISIMSIVRMKLPRD